MNPALLNYLQSQQLDTDEIGLSGSMEGVNPQTLLNRQMESNNNPFDSGIRRAVETARESLGMTEKQQDKALRRGLLNFAANIANTPKQKGFFANFGAASRAAIPAMIEYDTAGSAYEAENNALANQILAYQDKQKAELAKAEEQAWKRQLEEDKLAESRRYHDLTADYQNAKLNAQNQSAVSPLGDNFAPIESKAERTNYSKLKQSTGEVLGDLKEIEKQFQNLQSITKDDLVNPMNPYIGSYANKTKDLFTYFSKDSTDKGKLEREKSIKRKAFEAEVNKFQVEFERKLKGGVLGKGIIEIFDKKKMLPSVGDAPDVFAQKLEDLEKMISNRYEAADTSLRYNTHISPYDMENLKKQQGMGQNNQREEGTTNVIMQDNLGNKYNIPSGDVESALNDPNEPLTLVE